MTVLVTGGVGYIGSHVTVSLLEKEHDVVVIDNHCNSEREALKRMEQVTGKSIRSYETDLCDSAELEAVFQKEHVDAVIHLAGYKSIKESVEQPLKYFRNNLISTITLLETMEKFSVHRLVFSSSATVYGAAGDGLISERTPAGGCTNPYGRTKYYIEGILGDAAAANSALSVVSLRYFNPVGAHSSGLIGESPQCEQANLMPCMVQVATGKRKKLLVYGGDYPTPDGTGVRDYLHVADLARGHVSAIEYAKEASGVQAVNLGSGRGTSVLELIAAFERTNNVEIPYEITDRRSGDVASCCCDPTLAQTLFGWKAELSLEDMCRDAYHWQIKNPNGYQTTGV